MSFLSVDPQTIVRLNNSSLFTIVEFFSVTVVILVAYLGLHNVFGHLKPATKMLFSMLFGALAYTVGKLAVFTLVIQPLIY